MRFSLFRSTGRSRTAGAVALFALGALLVVACSGDDGADGAASDGDVEPSVRFCDAYLDYLADRTPRGLADVVEASGDDEEVAAYAGIIGGDEPTGRVVTATDDLDELARVRCQAEWIGGAQGAGNTGAAASAFADALIAGDRFGARNVASANVIAVFEPWRPADVVVVETVERAFVLTIDDDGLAECQVETGVVVTCDVVRDG